MTNAGSGAGLRLLRVDCLPKKIRSAYWHLHLACTVNLSLDRSGSYQRGSRSRQQHGSGLLLHVAGTHWAAHLCISQGSCCTSRDTWSWYEPGRAASSGQVEHEPHSKTETGVKARPAAMQLPSSGLRAAAPCRPPPATVPIRPRAFVLDRVCS